MVLGSIVLATLLSGAASVLAAMSLTFSMQRRLIPVMVGFSAGLMLGTAILHLLPEAYESGASMHELSWVLLAGLVVFFALEKALIFRHSHHHEGDGHDHDHGHDRHEAGPGGTLIVVGDSLHNLGDGVLIAAAFISDPHLGWATAFAVAMHEIPQEMGDFIVMLNAGLSRRRALAYNLVSSLAAVVGGVAGYFVLNEMLSVVPFVVAFTASTLIYISLADLVPDMHRTRRHGAAAIQFALLLLGIAVSASLSLLSHTH